MDFQEKLNDLKNKMTEEKLLNSKVVIFIDTDTINQEEFENGDEYE